MTKKPVQPLPLQFINLSTGTLNVGGSDVRLHWDLDAEVAWLSRGIGGEKSFATAVEFCQVRALWRAITCLSNAFIDREPYPDDALALLNSWAEKPSLVPALGNQGLAFSCSSISAALTWLAVEAICLLGKTRTGQIRRCQGCSMVYIDKSPTGRQRWCPKGKCGNRSKVRAFNERKKAASTSD